MPTLIDGIAASENIDSSGEIISVAGMDISSLDKTGNFNWEHKKDQPNQIVGKILKAKKIFKAEDCDNERERYFWNKCKVPYVYVMGELFDEYTDSGKHVAGLFKYDADKKGINEHNVVGFSIEGAKLDKKGMTITRSIARKCTITEAPCNKAAIAEAMPEKPKKTEDLADFFKSESSFKTVPYVEIELFKSDLFADVKKAEDPHHHANKLGITPMNKPAAPAAPAPMDKSAVGIKKPAAPAAQAKAPAKTFGQTPFRDPGHTMGRTSSGKDVMSHQRIHEYRGFSTKDHEEAAKMHFEHSQGAKDPKTGAHHLDRMKLHLQAAQTSARKDDRLKVGMEAKRKKLMQKAMNPPAQKPAPGAEQKMEKAMTAGSGMTAPSECEGGAALAKESLEKTYASDAQRRWAHTPKGTKALGGKAAVKEWDEKSKGKKLPERVSKSEQWLARAEEEYAKWEKKEQFQAFMKKRMPHLTKGEIDAFGKTMLLKKTVEAEKSLRKFSDIMMANEDKIPGGLADKKSPKDFDAQSLAEGVKVEMEHTSDPKVAREIAMDHLTEDKEYYKKLKTVEKK